MRRGVAVGRGVQPVLAVEIPDGVRVRVDEARQHGAAAQIYDSRPRWHGPAWRDAGNAAANDENVHVALHTAAAIEDGGGAQNSPRGVLGLGMSGRRGEHDHEQEASPPFTVP